MYLRDFLKPGASIRVQKESANLLSASTENGQHWFQGRGDQGVVPPGVITVHPAGINSTELIAVMVAEQGLMAPTKQRHMSGALTDCLSCVCSFNCAASGTVRCPVISFYNGQRATPTGLGTPNLSGLMSLSEHPLCLITYIQVSTGFLAVQNACRSSSKIAAAAEDSGRSRECYCPQFPLLLDETHTCKRRATNLKTQHLKTKKKKRAIDPRLSPTIK